MKKDLTKKVILKVISVLVTVFIPVQVIVCLSSFSVNLTLMVA